MKNSGIGRARMFMGGVLLFAAAIVWAITLMMSPHGSSTADGPEHVRAVVATYIRNSAIMTLILCALAGWLLFPLRRPRAPRRDWSIGVALAVLAATSVYQLVWLQTAVLS